MVGVGLVCASIELAIGHHAQEEGKESRDPLLRALSLKMDLTGQCWSPLTFQVFLFQGWSRPGSLSVCFCCMYGTNTKKPEGSSVVASSRKSGYRK